MEERPFTDPKSAPTLDALHETLGPAAAFLDELLVQTADFRRAWSHSKRGGWLDKVHDGKKALFYLIPLHGSFRSSMAVRDAERDTLLGEPALAALHDRLAEAKRYSEGWALAVDVTDAASWAVVRALVGRLIALRR